MGGSLCPGHTGDTERSQAPIQTLQGGVQPCTPAPQGSLRAPCPAHPSEARAGRGLPQGGTGLPEGGKDPCHLSEGLSPAQ